MKRDKTSVKKASLKEQKELANYIRDFIKKNGDPYDEVRFEFDVDERRDCWNWMNFLGFVNDLEEAIKNNSLYEKKDLEDLRNITNRFFIQYYQGEK
ncbi:MAG: hypothetical protein OXC92_04390 [Flavobacteriaceae bacterium]|nr:hypothetical protein [Flavobacteriaceae bacterium]MCY4216208.1 hypothetical protein [Flavobacteriaceae bacterium]MCY4266501.1 hypothetical protein [Flavobacteriaceae bacterium]MCY4298123.1 hypothetical protein [Flavobacteriaceae bacterium]